MIAVTDLKKVYRQANRDIHALDGVTLTVPENSVHGVIGQSGAGKSTLVRCLALLDRPTSGVVEINGVELTAVPSAELRRARRRLGVVFQHANLFDSRTITANVAYPLELAGVGRAARTAKATELLGLVGLAEAGDAHPAQLSGGQRQRVGIARALATDPDVLLCDEPTSALDPATTGEILDLISALKVRLGLAVLVITHEMNVVKRICDSVSLLEDGRVVESGPLTEVVGTFGSRLS
ncbi:MAG TPA: ATP-binding cassette domain-containing protein, partial [Propionicimonas sp.]|nr:ATP-binding cassette domain-containing protein [Propionicimonas sp.]